MKRVPRRCTSSGRSPKRCSGVCSALSPNRDRSAPISAAAWDSAGESPAPPSGDIAPDMADRAGSACIEGVSQTKLVSARVTTSSGFFAAETSSSARYQPNPSSRTFIATERPSGLIAIGWSSMTRPFRSRTRSRPSRSSPPRSRTETRSSGCSLAGTRLLRACVVSSARGICMIATSSNHALPRTSSRYNRWRSRAWAAGSSGAGLVNCLGWRSSRSIWSHAAPLRPPGTCTVCRTQAPGAIVGGLRTSEFGMTRRCWSSRREVMNARACSRPSVLMRADTA